MHFSDEFVLLMMSQAGVPSSTSSVCAPCPVTQFLSFFYTSFLGAKGLLHYAATWRSPCLIFCFLMKIC